MRKKPTICTLPEGWAAALINDDYSGLDAGECQQIDAWLNANNPGTCVGVSDETDFRQFQGIGHTVCEYQFIKY